MRGRRREASDTRAVRDCLVGLLALRGWDAEAMRRIGRAVETAAGKQIPHDGEGAMLALRRALEEA